MISVLCPSRGRPDLLAESLRSLTERATQPLELLVAADPDDPETIQVATDLGAVVVVAPRRYGYQRLHWYYNMLAQSARGEWLLLWNDDALMSSDRWDEAIYVYRPAYVLQTIKGICFPAIPTAWVHHLGHFAAEWHCDAWWEQIGEMLDRTIKTGLEGTHHNPPDQTSDDARGQKRNPDFYGAENMALMRRDANKLRELL